MDNDYYTLQEISERTKAPVSYLRNIIKGGELKAKRLGKHYVVASKDIENYLDKQEVKV